MNRRNGRERGGGKREPRTFHNAIAAPTCLSDPPPTDRQATGPAREKPMLRQATVLRPGLHPHPASKMLLTGRGKGENI